MFWQKLLKILQVLPYGAHLLLIKKRKSVKTTLPNLCDRFRLNPRCPLWGAVCNRLILLENEI